MTEEEWADWRHQKLTKKFFESLSGYRENFKEQWAEGTYLSGDAQQTQNMQQRMFGMMEALAEIANLDYSTYKEWSEQ